MLQQIESFFIQNGLFDTHGIINQIEGKYDAIYKFRKKCIDSIAVTYSLLSIIKECKMTDFTEIITIDYRRFILDIDLEQYFKIIID